MKKVFLPLLGMLLISNVFAQTFEEAKLDGDSFVEKKVDIGADFALQYQALDMQGMAISSGSNVDFVPLGSGFNLPTANFSISALLAPGIKVNLMTYLSARHHNETWVEGGYLLVDQMRFLNSDVVDNLMDILTVKAGVMELNYGDGHFRRSNNGRVINNAFVGNYIMDAFTTAPAIEILLRSNDIIGLIGITNGNLKPELVAYSDDKDGIAEAEDYNKLVFADELAYYGKIGMDKQVNDDLRIRATASLYYQDYSHRGTLYSGDRAGARFYSVMNPVTLGATGTDIKSNHTNGRWGPGGTEQLTSTMINTFIKYKGAELFGLYEVADGKTSKADFKFTQLALELLYRFGGESQFYGGGKYNTVKNQDDAKVTRTEIGGGWFMTDDIVVKLEYVNQEYNKFATYTDGAGFKGMMLEAAISF